jgi:exopolysaccharide biosynthesis polyprenyl glycosylphosphotransferase
VVIRRFSIDEVVFIIPNSRLGLVESAIRVCETLGTKATLALDFFNVKLAKAHQTELDGVPFISFETTPASEWQILLKRGLDITLSAIGIALLSPVLLVTAGLIKATSPGPVFFLQKRLGLNGRRFVLYKFRTMYKGAHRMQRSLMAMNIMQGPAFKMKNDPRVTPLGSMLRKLSIDELPQLFNVFFGDMSLVGPRPPVAREVKQYELWQRRRLSMPPGITCLWQISGRNKIVDFNEWMKLDLQYIDKWSLWLDIKLICKTIPTVLSGIGAY